MKINIKRWSPTDFTTKDIISLITEHGTENDSLIDEKRDENTVPWEITIEAKRDLEKWDITQKDA